jgi:hypothetical protein
MRPGGYKKVFNMNQNDLFSDILGVLEETYNAYKSSKLVQDSQLNIDNKNDDYYGFKDKSRIFKNSSDAFVEPQKITSSIFHSSVNGKGIDTDKNYSQKQENDMMDSNSEYDGKLNYKKYSDNQNIISNNPISNLPNYKRQSYTEQSKGNISTAKDSYSSNYYYNNNSYSQFKNNNGGNSTNIKSFISQNQANVSNTDSIKLLPNQKQYNIRPNYSNYSNNYSRKENDASSNSSYLMRKKNRAGSRSSSENRKDNNNSYYHKKDNRNYSDYDERKYNKYYKYNKDYDRYDKKERKNSPFKDYYYEDSSYNNNPSNDYSLKYYDRDREIDRDKDRDR